ncbi:UDP-glycosyltransferase 86A1 [Sesamum alatum]|uniref:Glycosyltransferase n=1 Tax=Sesamum alatum TaxID=300844 RepID=A0AAE1XWD7_9LAMI|nr:UDP-glycosyltransferase 86A1 [Sesamum alatum]
MVSLHLQGHIIPFVNLAMKLASKGFSVTFAHLEFVHHQISRSQYSSTDTDIFAQARSSGLDIIYTTISDGFPLEFDRDSDVYLESFLCEFPEKVDELVGKVMQSDSSSCSSFFLLSDTFSVWPAKIAEKYGLVDVSFWTEPALVFSLYYHLQLLRENGHVPVNGRKENVDYLPGIRSINTKDFMSYLQDSELTVLHKLIFQAFDSVKSADFILCNTVQELEEEAISALQEKQPFYAIGPLFQGDFKKNSVPRSLLPESNCEEWLNSRPAGSVLYISFGSLAKVTDKNVILEIAGGILLSQVKFIWVLRPGMVDSDGGGILPEGFEDRTRDRGLIVPWCSQNQVLSNPATGGFLTHCGWNSIVESIWSGVPMICYPLFTDQITNRKLVVDDWKVGMNLCDGASVTREEVAEKIGVLMSGKRGEELMQEIKKVRETLRNALTEYGSSEKNFDCFVKDVKDEIERRCKKM